MHIPQFPVRKVKKKMPPAGTTVSSSADHVVKHLLFFFHLPLLLPSMSASSSGRLTQMAADMPPAAASVPFHLWSQWAHWKGIVSLWGFLGRTSIGPTWITCLPFNQLLCPKDWDTVTGCPDHVPASQLLRVGHRKPPSPKSHEMGPLFKKKKKSFLGKVELAQLPKERKGR